jgi:nucleoid DNA-binding protein
VPERAGFGEARDSDHFPSALKAARKGRNPATGEEIKIKASKASKKVAFRVAKGLREAI